MVTEAFSRTKTIATLGHRFETPPIRLAPCRMSTADGDHSDDYGAAHCAGPLRHLGSATDTIASSPGRSSRLVLKRAAPPALSSPPRCFAVRNSCQILQWLKPELYLRPAFDASGP